MIKRSKYISWKECSQNGNTYLIFFKIAEEDPFSLAVVWERNQWVETNDTDDECAKCQGSYNEGEERLCCPACYQWYHNDLVL